MHTYNMKVELIITIIIAIGGWGFGLYQMFKNRRWQQKDLLANRRYEEYNRFMRKLEQVNESVRKNPNLIYGMSNDFLSVVLNGNAEEINTALLKYNQEILDFVKKSTEPLWIINQEISPLLLIASDDLSKLLSRLKELIEDFNAEMQNCLSKVSTNDSNSFKAFETIGHDERWKEFKTLNDDILQLMRKEINIK